MSKDRLDISDNTAISMPVRNMLVIIKLHAVDRLELLQCIRTYYHA